MPVRNTGTTLHCPSFRDWRPDTNLGAFFIAQSSIRHNMTEIYPVSFLRWVLMQTRRIAVAGISLNGVRPSYFVGRYLAPKQFDVVPVNPVHAGKIVFTQTGAATLSDIDGDVDMVDFFRRSDHVPPIVEDAPSSLPNPRTVWMQIGVSNAGAADLVRSRGVNLIMNRRPEIEYQRLCGETRMVWFSTGVIASEL